MSHQPVECAKPPPPRLPSTTPYLPRVARLFVFFFFVVVFFRDCFFLETLVDTRITSGRIAA